MTQKRALVALTLLLIVFALLYVELKEEFYCLAPRIQLPMAVALASDLITLASAIAALAVFLAPGLRTRLRAYAGEYIRHRGIRAIILSIVFMSLLFITLNSALRALQGFTTRTHSGTTTIRHTCMLDLDTGNLAPPGERADVYFHVVSLAEEYLEPKNGAAIARMADMPSPSECAVATLSDTPIRLRDTPMASWLCYRTSQRRIGRLYLEGLSPEWPDPHRYLTIRYETW